MKGVRSPHTDSSVEKGDNRPQAAAQIERGPKSTRILVSGAVDGVGRCQTDLRQEPVSGWVVEEPGIADLSGGELHGLVPADLLHLADVGAVAGRGGHEPKCPA